MIGIGVEGLEGIVEVVGEFEGLDEASVWGRRFFLSRPLTGALPGSSIGVKGVISGANILKLFLRLFAMTTDNQMSASWGPKMSHMLERSLRRECWRGA